MGSVGHKDMDTALPSKLDFKGKTLGRLVWPVGVEFVTLPHTISQNNNQFGKQSHN